MCCNRKNVPHLKKCATLEKMSHTSKNVPHLNVWKNVPHLKKFATLEKMSHT